MLEHPPTGQRAILVHLDIHRENSEEELREFKELATSAGADIVALLTGSRRIPDAKYFIGSGKAQELAELLAVQPAQVVIVNHDLSPSQERNLERLVKCRVLSRQGLILDIFAQRAQSHEGKLQVELAQLQHLSTRLIRGWTHLERQKGGIGLRGPGETQLETDRRLIGHRIKLIKKRLEKVKQQRQQGRRTRVKAGMKTVSLIGYTNAGKSTLFNRITGAHQLAEQRMFATLDPSLRRLPLASRVIILADTVGFVRDLPHELIEAFQSTLQETREADLLLHVIDVSSDDREQRIQQVEMVLEEIGAGGIPRIQVYNKIDLLGMEPHIEYTQGAEMNRIWLSSHTGDGFDLLLRGLDEYFKDDVIRQWFCLPAGAGKIRARLFDMGAVKQEKPDQEGGWKMELEVARKDLLALASQAPYLLKQI